LIKGKKYFKKEKEKVGHGSHALVCLIIEKTFKFSSEKKKLFFLK